ncbi:hypothetical protein [uncultured Variovorax sp.]|uniref:hypothetical protein n=1 Tax=uncultured Variovorax sp. TaxID=114708 RepID=UPI0025E51B0F|nr:hypothetical protein [uncultured Variovorax sp.]
MPKDIASNDRPPDLCRSVENVTGRSDAPARRRPWLQSMVALAVAALIGWGCLMGATEVLEGLRTGVLDNRKGPDVLAAEQPLLYWALIGFYTVATLTAAGLALLVLAIALRDLVGARGPDR